MYIRCCYVWEVFTGCRLGGGAVRIGIRAYCNIGMLLLLVVIVAVVVVLL